MLKLSKFNKYLVGIVICLIILFSFLLIRIENKSEIHCACFDNHCFNLEIADTSEARRLGLMFREHLSNNQAMLFVFPDSGIHSFWMKNTLIPLDIIWLNESLEIVFIEHQAPPCSDEVCPVFLPTAPAKYVLEIRGGLAEELGLQIGQPLIWER